MDILSVITLGKPVEQPLMCLSSELTDGLEPHGHITQPLVPGCCTWTLVAAAVVPGVVQTGGYQGGVHTGYPAGSIIEAYLMNY